MSKKRHTAEQIIGKLREAEVLLAQGQTVQDASRPLGHRYCLHHCGSVLGGSAWLRRDCEHLMSWPAGQYLTI